MVKSKLSPRSGSSFRAVESHPLKWGHKVLIFNMINFVYKLLQDLSNDLRIRTLGNEKTIGKPQEGVKTQPSVSSPLHKSISFNNGKKVVKFLFYII